MFNASRQNKEAVTSSAATNAGVLIGALTSFRRRAMKTRPKVD